MAPAAADKEEVVRARLYPGKAGVTARRKDWIDDHSKDVPKDLWRDARNVRDGIGVYFAVHPRD